MTLLGPARDDQGIVRHRLSRAALPLVERVPPAAPAPPLPAAIAPRPNPARAAERRGGDRRRGHRPTLLDTRLRDRRAAASGRAGGRIELRA
jgi:hypothetical protein